MRKDIVVDLETLGLKDDAPLFQIAAATFDIRTGRITHTYNKVCKIDNFNNIEGGTAKFWLSHSELFSDLLDRAEFDNEKDLVEDFVDWMTVQSKSADETYLWGNGSLFDNQKIKTKCNQYGFVYPIHFRNDRDIRTIVDTAKLISGISEPSFKELCSLPDLEAHNAINDVIYEINLVMKSIELINKGDNSNGHT